MQQQQNKSQPPIVRPHKIHSKQIERRRQLNTNTSGSSILQCHDSSNPNDFGHFRPKTVRHSFYSGMLPGHYTCTITAEFADVCGVLQIWARGSRNQHDICEFVTDVVHLFGIFLPHYGAF